MSTSIYHEYEKALLRPRDPEIFTTDSDTASSLLGPGRVLGKLFSRLGDALEKRIGLVADRLGYGPLAAHRRLSQGARDRGEWMEDPDWLLAPVLENGIRDVRKLVQHVRSLSHVTQAQALESIIYLLSRDSAGSMRKLLQDAKLNVVLGTFPTDMAAREREFETDDPDINVLLALVQTASILLEGDEIHPLVEPLLLNRKQFLERVSVNAWALLPLFVERFAAFHQLIVDTDQQCGGVSISAESLLAETSSLRLTRKRLYEMTSGAFHRSQPMSLDEMEQHLTAWFVACEAGSSQQSLRHQLVKVETARGATLYYSILEVYFPQDDSTSLRASEREPFVLYLDNQDAEEIGRTVLLTDALSSNAASSDIIPWLRSALKIPASIAPATLSKFEFQFAPFKFEVPFASPLPGISSFWTEKNPVPAMCKHRITTVWERVGAK